MPDIAVLDTFSIPVHFYDALRDLGRMKLYPELTTDPDIIIKRADGADVVVVNKTQLNRNLLHSLSSVGLIAEAASGYDNIDVEAAAELGIQVCNVPGYSTDSVAELVFCLILSMERNMELCRRQVKQSKWVEEKLAGTEISGKTLGIVGFGRIGRSVAAIAGGFGMELVVHTRSPSTYADDHPDVTFVSLKEVMERADIVTLHMPHTDKTDKIISKGLLDLMKPNALLVNTARGGVIDEQALCNALGSGKIRFCGDVLAHEPIQQGEPLAGFENSLITPHVGWYTNEAIERLMQEVYNNIKGFFDDEPRNIVNGI